MKRIFVCLLTVLILLSGCSSKTELSTNNQTESVETTVEPLDLAGLWIQEDKDDRESYMVADIRDEGKIGVFFIMENDEQPWTYWVGTYEKPSNEVEEYSWVSENTYAGNGMLASSAETKEFSYKNGKISYSVTIQGETGTVTLIRGDWDTSNIPESAFGSVKTSQADFTSLEIKDSGWMLKNNEWLYYYVNLYNPSKEIAVEFPGFKITARDSEGILLGSDEQILSIIYPGEEFIYGSQAFSVDEMPSTVEFTPLDFEEYNLKNISVLSDFTPLEVINTAVRSDKLVGEIYNPNSTDIDLVAITAICKNSNGDLLDIETTFVNDVKATGNTAFSINNSGIDENATIEYYAHEW